MNKIENVSIKGHVEQLLNCLILLMGEEICQEEKNEVSDGESTECPCLIRLT